jgi:hypothetical protein
MNAYTPRYLGRQRATSTTHDGEGGRGRAVRIVARSREGAYSIS